MARRLQYLVANWMAATAGASEMDGQSNREFRKLDANRDGRLDADEFKS